jgi:hypothetical protein
MKIKSKIKIPSSLSALRQRQAIEVEKKRQEEKKRAEDKCKGCVFLQEDGWCMVPLHGSQWRWGHIPPSELANGGCGLVDDTCSRV